MEVMRVGHTGCGQCELDFDYSMVYALIFSLVTGVQGHSSVVVGLKANSDLGRW